jgi:hypothetical protein
MSAQELVLGKNELSALDVPRGTEVRVRSGCVWLTQHKDANDHILKTGDAMSLSGAGTTIVTAFEPTLLDLYRQDPVALREQLTRRAHRARNAEIGAFFARLFT